MAPEATSHAHRGAPPPPFALSDFAAAVPVVDEHLRSRRRAATPEWCRGFDRSRILVLLRAQASKEPDKRNAATSRTERYPVT